MNPYYQEDGITLYCGDCRDILPTFPDKSFDLVLTDPPYGVEGGHGGQLRDYRKADYGNDFDDSPDYIATVVVPIISQCVAKFPTVVLTPGTRCLCSYPQPDEVGAFFAPAASRIGKFGFQSVHPIFYYGLYKNRGKGALPTGIVLTEIAEKNGHPCPKPIGAWSWLLDRCSELGWSVLDPFCGSGTTLVAAKQLGRKAVGVEISEKYCEIAVKRLAQKELFGEH